ncbi:MAG: hypothetical protein OXS28_17605 [Gammaproteobacteria bacterium]|nr:hypothetical protein [Gammaproteobacteria bacterium]
MKKEFRDTIKTAATIEDDARRDALIDHLIDHFHSESDLRPERWLRLFGNFISLIVGLLTSALLLWLIYDSYIDDNYDFAKTVLTSGIGGAVIGSIATYYFQRGDK